MWRRAAASFSRDNLVELLAFGGVFAVLLSVLLAIDAFDAFYEYSRAHEDWELDEIVVTLCCLGITGFVFVARRWRIEYKDKRAIRELTEDLKHALGAAQSADKAKSAFLAGLSHELRTPLNAINGYAQFIEMGLMGPLAARYSGYGKDIRESGEHLLAIVDDILDMTRIIAGKVTLHPQPLDLRELTETSFRLVAPRAESSGVGLSNGVDPHFPPVMADAQRLKQVLVNLLGNAVKFSPPGAQVAVAARETAAGVVIEVRDQGIGMKPKDVERALEPFTQLDDGLDRGHEGTGLGLAIVKSFVELHGGRLRIDSASGQGTTVTVVLPQTMTSGAGAGPSNSGTSDSVRALSHV